jgi:tryptophanyl-tRNA synthetase
MNLKNTIEKILTDKNVEYRFIPLPAELPADVPSHAAFHGISLANAMTTILYRTEKGIIAAVKRADTQVDQEALKAIAGVSTLTFASKEDLKAIGTEVGLVPFLGLNIPFYIDENVMGVGKIYGTSGDALMGMSMNATDLPLVNAGKVSNFARLEQSASVPMGKRFLSGITPSGDGSLHIGNYLGAVKQFIELSKNNETFLMVADLHGLTTIQDKKHLSRNIETLVLEELSLLLGFLGEEKFNSITFFRQSDVTMHTEFQSILNNVTPLGLLKRAHAYKDKLAKDVMEDDVNLGLFNYPILMASDILLYKPDLVPVGKDQKQHIEITRDVADRFNRIYKKHVLKLPDPFIPEAVSVVLGTDGKRKMSKSLGNLISIFDEESVIKKQVNGTYTDPTRVHATDKGHIEGNMVFSYLHYFGDTNRVEELKEQYKEGTVSDVAVKEYLFECLQRTFAPARQAYAELKANPKRVKAILKLGQEKALAVATQTMKEVRDAIGVTTSYSFFEYPKVNEGDTVSIDDFAKIRLTVGHVVSATHKEGSDKLIRLVVDVGEPEKRIIFTGVRTFGYTHEDFSGKQFFFITNLAPRKMLDEYSQGMILAVDGADGRPQFISAEEMSVGATIR